MSHAVAGGGVAGMVLGAVPFSSRGRAAADLRVSVANSGSPFSQNKQGEPGVCINPLIRTSSPRAATMRLTSRPHCRPDDDYPFTEGVGTAGIYFSLDAGESWIQ